jgi:hypothetical protein
MTKLINTNGFGFGKKKGLVDYDIFSEMFLICFG